jgi:uncharacterized protein
MLPWSVVTGQVIAPTGDWVTDRAGLLTTSEINSLSASLAGHEETSSTQIVIVTLPDLDGRDAASYAFELGDTWGVGQEGVDNGIVILVSVGDRKVFIATGYGVEASVPDVIAGRIIREIITPHFRRGQYYQGLQTAVDALIEATGGRTPTQLSKSPAGSFDTRRLVFVLFVIAIILIVFFVIRRMGSDDDWHDDSGRRRRRRGRGWPYIIWGGGFSHGGRGGGFSGGFGGGGGFGGCSGGGGSFGGGGAGGGW